jgi:predicted MPP superfamily phosphohydrolase
MASNQALRRFSWLLFGDIKMGAEEWEGPQRKTFLNGFLEDLEKVHSEAGPFDAVFFTGDFVWGGRVANYVNCSQLLDLLFGRLEDLGSKPKMFCVPGNHDLLRSADTDVLARVPQYSWDDGIDEAFLWRTLSEALGPYDAWASRWRYSGVRWGSILGDFSADIEKDEFLIGIVGLNTTVNQGSAAAPGWTPLSRRRVESLCGGPVERWAETRRIRVLLSHHPPYHFRYPSEWNLPMGRRGFQLDLCGHLHHGSTKSLFPLEALPVFAAPRFSPQGAGESGYVAGAVDLDEPTGLSLRYRVFSTSTGAWQSVHRLQEVLPVPFPSERAEASAPTAKHLVKQDEPVYIESLRLSGFRCFDEIDLPFHHQSSLPGRWTCIAGINGAGKSSILQALGIVLLGNPVALELGGGRLNRMRRRANGVRQRAEIRAELRAGSADNPMPMSLQLDIDDNRIVSSGALPSQEWQELRSRVIVAYGATRNLSPRIDPEYESLSSDVQRMITMFDPLSQLASAEVLLKQQAATGPFLPLFQSVLREVFEADLQVETGPDAVRFTVVGKDRVEAIDLPDGFRASVAWMADLCACWCEKAPGLAASANPADIHAIVLLDEIDLHLHPALQRKLVPKLRTAMPRVQWIVTTHSPLVLANFDSNEIIALDRDCEGNIRPLDRQIMGFSSDQIYQWLMGTPPTGEAIEEILEKNETSGKPTDDEVAELLEISPKVSELEARERVEKLKDAIAQLKP